jgi:hypothetical protein
LVQACQRLWLAGSHDVYQQFTWVSLKFQAIFYPKLFISQSLTSISASNCSH